MSINDEVNSIEDISQASGYIMMGLSLSFPIVLYILIRNVFRYFMKLDSVLIVPWAVLLIANLGMLVYLHVVDICSIRKVCGKADKLIATLFAFQPMYFACRQDMLGRPKKGAILYAVISTVEVAVVLIVYIVACLSDVVELLL